MAKSCVKEPLKGQVGKAIALGPLTTSSMQPDVPRQLARAEPFHLSGREGGAPATGAASNWHHTCSLKACRAGVGRCTALSRSDTWEPPLVPAPPGPAKAEPGHPPFSSLGSGCPPAGRQRSGPRGGAVGSSLCHFPRYFERTPFQDPQTCGHCTCLLNEIQVKSAGKEKKKKKKGGS